MEEKKKGSDDPKFIAEQKAAEEILRKLQDKKIAGRR